MKIEIYKEKKDIEKTLVLKLVQIRDSIMLAIVDENGDVKGPGNILSINSEDGTLTRHSYVDSNSGLKLDSEGRIKEKNLVVK